MIGLLLWGVGWALLLTRPRWGFLVFLATCLAAYDIVTLTMQGMRMSADAGQPVDTSALAVAVAISTAFGVAVFSAVGAIIIVLDKRIRRAAKPPTDVGN
jgi:hypothetical protein